MKKFLLLAAPLLAVSLPSPALAQPHGFRFEGVAGYDEFRIDFDGAGPGTRQNVHGVYYGVGAGFDFPVAPNLGIGPEVEATEATTDRDLGASNFTVRRDIYLGGRLTAAVSNSFNLYGRLGYSSVRVRTRPDNTALPIAAETHGGIRGAIGVQFDDDDSNAYYGFEVRFTGYGDGVSRRQAGLVIGARF